MSAQVACIDHPVLAVNNLDIARERFQKLGFVVPPIGRHREWGTGNLCIMFEKDYLEIRGIADRSRYLAGLEEFLADGEGLIGVAFGTLSAEESFRAAQDAGLNVSRPQDLRRRLELPDAVLDLHFRNVMLKPEDHPGFSHANLCQHLTPGHLRQPGWLDHPNTAISIRKVVGVVGDLDNARKKYEALLGVDAVSRSGNAVWLSFPTGASVELITPGEAARRGIDQPARDKDYTASISVGVRHLDELTAALTRNGIDFTLEGSTVVVNPADACGAHLTFVRIENA